MDLEASESERRELEYATQFFEFTPDSFVDTISFSSTDIIDEELNKLKKTLSEKFSNKISERELEDCFTIVKDQYTEAAEKVLTVFGKYLKKNILCVPRHVLLPEDKAHAGRPFTGDDLENSLKNVDNLCLKIRNAKYKRAILQAKLANLQKVSLRQEKLLQEVNNLAEQKNQMEALYDRQALILEEKLQSLRPLVEKLENNVTVVDDDSKATKTETPSGEDSLKRKLELEKMILAKRLKIEDEDD